VSMCHKIVKLLSLLINQSKSGLLNNISIYPYI